MARSLWQGLDKKIDAGERLKMVASAQLKLRRAQGGRITKFQRRLAAEAARLAKS